MNPPIRFSHQPSVSPGFCKDSKLTRLRDQKRQVKRVAAIVLYHNSYPRRSSAFSWSHKSLNDPASTRTERVYETPPNRASSWDCLILGSNSTSKGNGWVFMLSVKASVSMGADGGSEIRNAQRCRAVFMNTDLSATYWPGHTRLPNPNGKVRISSRILPSSPNQRWGSNF